MIIMEHTVIRTVFESKPHNEEEFSTEMYTSAAHHPEVEHLIGHDNDTELMPYEGMEFESEDAARDFYSIYARNSGFRIRVSRYTCSRRDNSIISRCIVCSKEGFYETRNCEGFHNDQKHQERTGSRVGCKAMIMIKRIGPGKWVFTKFVKNHNHGPDPARKLDVSSTSQECNPTEKSHSIEVDPTEALIEGMEFDSEEAAKLFYINYAKHYGFRARISRYCRSRRDNSIISRQIVCSKEGFREVRAKKEMADDGKTKRPRMVTRVGCKAMIVVKKINSGKWMVSKFEKEHNHSLLSSKLVPTTSNFSSGEVTGSAVKCSDPNESKVEGYSAGIQFNSADSLTVLYNHLCQEAIKFAKEGSVTEAIYHVAKSALKEAAEKIAQVKSSHPTIPHCGFSISESKHKILQIKTRSASQFSNEVKQKITLSKLKPFQDSTSNLVVMPTNFLVDSSLSNCVDNTLSSCDFPINGGQDRYGSEGSYFHTVDRKENSSDKYQGKRGSFPGHSEETAVAIPATPLKMYMPFMRNSSGASADGQYRLLAAPIEAVPISYRPAEPIIQPQQSFCNLCPLAGVLSDPNRKGKAPNSMVHTTARACGARVVPLKEAASLIKAIESKIRSGGATIARLPLGNLTPLVTEAASVSSSSEEDVENGHNEPLVANFGSNSHVHSSDEMQLQAEPSIWKLNLRIVPGSLKNENHDSTDC